MDRIGIPCLENEEDWRNRTKFWTDCLNVEMWQLIPLSETVDIFKGLTDGPSSQAAININIVKEMKKRIYNKQLRERKLPVISVF